MTRLSERYVAFLNEADCKVCGWMLAPACHACAGTRRAPIPHCELINE